MDEPTAEQLAYFNAPATRAELMQVLSAVRKVMTVQAEVGIAFLEGEEGSAREALASLRDPMEEMSVLSREMLNAGVDPEWDYRT